MGPEGGKEEEEGGDFMPPTGTMDCHLKGEEKGERKKMWVIYMYANFSYFLEP